MAGFRLDDTSEGCPPTETPPVDYTNPFRFDGSGRLWLTNCFNGYQYFGAATHNNTSPVILGSGTVPNAGVLVSPPTGSHITAGTYTNLDITNATECTIGVLLGVDITSDLEAIQGNYVTITASARWNGTHHSSLYVGTPYLSGATAHIRQILNSSSNPHDLGVDNSGTPSLTIAPGGSATVSARLYLNVSAGALDGTEILYGSATAIRTYGYVL